MFLVSTIHSLEKESHSLIITYKFKVRVELLLKKQLLRYFLFYCFMMQICASRFVLGITQFTLPLLCIRPVERRYNMFFYTFQKNLFFTGIFSPYSLSLIRVVFLVWFVPLQCLLCHFYAFWNTQEGHLCR